MNNNVRLYLIELARKRQGFIYYQELSDNCNLGFNFRESPYDRKEIGRILGEISEFEHNHDRPLLSALVLSKNLEEGDGFYKLCEELGFGSYRKLKGDPAFPSIQMNRCYEFWQNESNYSKYKDL
ncbi:MAG: hypothetical protein PHT84_02600 [Candidatus Pacebacteria bacterium]|jgi:hypothetical protein|nr:hypothetical protein [Candidatus Paceibacterota bacterium]